MITLRTKIGDLLKEEPKAVALLAENGMVCIGCGSAENETFEEACLAHGLDPVITLRKMNFRLYGKIC